MFKVSQDEQGTRLTWLRVPGGELKVKALLSGEADGEPWAEKANQLRLYSGAKYTLTEVIGPGQVCAVTGLTHAFGDTSGGFRRLIQIVFGLSIAFAASSFFLSFFSFGGGALI